MPKETITYPELRGLIAKNGITREEMGEVIGTTKDTFSSKLNGKSEFTLTELKRLFEFFVKIGEDVTIEGLFFE